MRFCTECGAQNTDESKFCVKCGERMYIPDEEQNASKINGADEEIEPGMDSYSGVTADGEESCEKWEEKQQESTDDMKVDKNPETRQSYSLHSAPQQIASPTLRAQQWQQPVAPAQANAQWRQPIAPAQANTQWRQYGQQEGAFQALADPMLDRIKAVGKSPIFLIGAILYSIIILASFINSIISSISISSAQRYYSVEAAASGIAGIMSALITITPSVLIMVGLWKVFAFANKSGDRSTGGFTLIKVSTIITLVLEFVAVGSMLFLGIIVMVVASGSRAPSEIISITFVATLAVVIVFAVMIIYSFLIIKTLNAIKRAVCFGIAKSNGVSGLIVLNIIIFLFNSVWLIITVCFDRMLYSVLAPVNDVLSYVGGQDFSYLFRVIISDNVLQIVLSVAGILVTLLFTIVLFMYKKVIRTYG